MSKTILVGGYGPGISSAVAEKFGAEGFSVALVGRSADKLDAGVERLAAKGVKGAAFTADLGDPAAIRALVGNVRTALGPITVLQWTAYGGAAGDLLTADTAAIRGVFDVPVTGLLTAIQESLPDLRKQPEAAILVTNGGLAYSEPQIDAMAVQWNTMGLAVANAAKHKLIGLLSQRLQGDGVYVGEVVVLGSVKGTPFDNGQATIEPSTVANKFWEIYRGRRELSVQVG